MGNLYTHLVNEPNPKINILYDLKLAWKARPIDYKYIKSLEVKLKNIQKNEPKISERRKKWVGQYG